MAKVKSKKHDKQAVKAARKYLKQIQEEYEIVGSYNYDSYLDIFDLVALNDGVLVFIQVRRFDGCYPHEVGANKIGPKRRGRMETALYRWLGWNNEFLDMSVRFDVIDVFVPDNRDRALIRHHINAGKEY